MDFQSTSAQLVKDLMRDFGLTEFQAAGLVGNLAYESGNFKQLQEKEPLIPGSKGGYGFAQWTGVRRDGFENWIKSQDSQIDPASYSANYGYLKHELSNVLPDSLGSIGVNTIRKLKDTNSLEEATSLVSNYYLRPAKETANIDKRQSRSKEIFDNSFKLEKDPLPKTRPDNLQMSNEPTVNTTVPQQTNIPQPQSFGQAFSQARQQHGGDGGVFEYNGNKYTTDIAKEVPAVAEPMFPREEFVPTVPPRVTSTADSRLNVPPFEGMEIPELGFNDGTKAVPSYKDGSNFISDFFSKYFNAGAVRNNQRVQEQEIINSVLDRNILDQENKEKAIMEAAQINAQRNAAAVPKLPDEKIIQTTLPPYVSNNDEIMQATLPRVNGPMNFKANTVNSLDNKANAPETQKQIDTKANMYAKSIADGSYGDPQAGYGEPVNKDISYHQSIYGPGVPQLGDEKALREREEYIQNLDMPVIKDKDPVESKDKTLSKDDNELKNNKASLVSETGLRLDASGNIIDSKGNKIEIPEPPNPDIKGKISSLLQTFFGLETADLGRAIGFYLASRATGASHAGSMRWAGTTVLKQAENNKVLNSKKSDVAITAFAKVSNKYTPSAVSKINRLLTEGKLVEAQTEMSKSSNMTARGQMGISRDDAGTQMIRRGYTTPTTVFTGTNGIYYEKITGKKDGKTFETYKPLTTADSNQLRPLGASDRESDYINNARKILDEMPSGYFRQAGTDLGDSSGEEKPAGLFGAADKAGVLADIRRLSKELATKGVPNMPEALALKLSGLAQLAESQGIKAISASQLLEIGFSGSDSLIDSKLITKDGDEETIIPSAEIVDFTKKFREQFNNDYNTSNKNMSTIVTEYRQVKPSSVKVIEQLDEFKSLTDKQKEEVKSAPNLFMSYALTKAYSNNK